MTRGKSEPVNPPESEQVRRQFVEANAFPGDPRPIGIEALGAALKREPRESMEGWLLRTLEATGALSRDVERGFLLSLKYSGYLNKAYALVYDLDAHEIVLWVDDTGHKPYALVRMKESEARDRLKDEGFAGLDGSGTVTKRDLLKDRDEEFAVLYGKTPTDVGGQQRRNIRNVLGPDNVWEAKIRYHHNYSFDRGLVPGMACSVLNGSLVQSASLTTPSAKGPAGTGTGWENFMDAFADEGDELREFAEHYAPIFQAEVPRLRRVSVDIEVEMLSGQLPNAQLAKERVISVAFADSDGKSWVFALDRPEVPLGPKPRGCPDDLDVTFFEDERELLRETFRVLWSYPIVVTFNGDNFDLNYLYHRAKSLDISGGANPIVFRRTQSFGTAQGEATLLKGVHVDLYRVFSDRSLKAYAFGSRYVNNSLEEIATALLGEGKHPHEAEIHEMPLRELVYYNWRDAVITEKLTERDDDLLFRLLVLMARMTKLPFNEVYRHSIAAWIRTMLYFEHRRKNYLIPNQSDLALAKPGGVTGVPKDGKGFKGAFVVDPVPGRHYGVVVMDFASLYPSIIKAYNLSYETVNCPHIRCLNETLPGVPQYHTCVERTGIFAVVVGFFRDVRVKWFKPRASDASLPEAERTYANVVQSALKVFINGSYGVFGSQNFDLFCLPVAESTTAIGREAIMRTIKHAREIGVEVIYGDSDSVFLLQPTEEQVADIKAWAERELLLELEVEKKYQFLALSGRKKNYLGVYEGGGYVDVKGLVGKKKNTPPFIKKVLALITDELRKVKDEPGFQVARKNVISIVRRALDQLNKLAFPLEDFAISVQMQKKIESYKKTTPQHVKAAKMLKEKQKLERGDVVTFVKTKGGVKPLEMAKKHEIDPKAYQQLLQGALEQVLDALDVSFEECRGLKGLGSFLGKQ
ncbi:MAG: DNA-directed DNA polymerase I [Promethearchaeota archaeon]